MVITPDHAALNGDPEIQATARPETLTVPVAESESVS
jgi:hypothetical protein